MIEETPYTDKEWQTVGMFPPPSTLVVHQWAAGGDGVSSPRPTLHNERVFAFLTQRKADATRIVPSVLDRHGSILAVEPGESWRHITFVFEPTNGNLSRTDAAIYSKWLNNRPLCAPDPFDRRADADDFELPE